MVDKLGCFGRVQFALMGCCAMRSCAGTPVYYRYYEIPKYRAACLSCSYTVPKGRRNEV